MSATSTATASPGGAPAAGGGDQRVEIHGVPWATYSAIRELLDSPGLKMTYSEGTLELMTPSPLHELRKTTIARLLEVFALEREVPLIGYGATTFRREARARALEPDECYVLDGELRSAPDIALEVVLTAGGVKKLPIYAALEVREVWFFEDGGFRLYRFEGAGYESIAQSELLPTLDFGLLARFAVRDDQHDAVREFRDSLRSRQA